MGKFHKYRFKIIIIFLSVVAKIASSQSIEEFPKDYMEYYRLTAEAENNLYKEEFSKALELYKLCFSKYEFVHAADAHTACQIAAYLKKKQDFDNLIFREYKQGVSYQLTRANKIIGPLISGKDSVKYKQLFAKGHEIYLSKLDMPLRKEWAVRYIREQESKANKVLFMKIRDENFARVVELSKQGKFPGERIIGIPFRVPGSTTQDNVYNDLYINCSFAFPTLVHTKFPYSQLEKTLRKEMLNGNISNWDFIEVYGAEQAHMGTWYPSGPVDTVKLPKRYNSLVFSVTCKDSTRVNRDRKELNLADYITPQKWFDFRKKFNFDLSH